MSDKKETKKQYKTTFSFYQERRFIKEIQSSGMTSAELLRTATIKYLDKKDESRNNTKG